MTRPRLCQRCGAPAMAGASACPYCGVSFEGAPVGGAAPPHPGGLGLGVDPEIARLLGEENKIGAIKLYRERTKCDLVTAKNAVEEIEKRLGIRR